MIEKNQERPIDSTEVREWLYCSYEGTGSFVIDASWLGGAIEAVADSLVHRSLQRDVSGWMDRDSVCVSWESQMEAYRIIAMHKESYALAAYIHFDNGEKPYVYDPAFIENWINTTLGKARVER